MRRGKISPVLACKEFGALLGADNLHRKALLAALLCSALSLSYACEPNDSSRVALFKGSPQKVTPFCIQAHCLKRGQIYYENIMPEFPREELPSAEAGIPSVLAFLSELSGHKSIEAWCAALKSRAELKRPLFCDKPAVVQRAVSRGIQPFDPLIISTNGEGRWFTPLLNRMTRHTEESESLFPRDAAYGRCSTRKNLPGA